MWIFLLFIGYNILTLFIRSTSLLVTYTTSETYSNDKKKKRYNHYSFLFYHHIMLKSNVVCYGKNTRIDLCDLRHSFKLNAVKNLQKCDSKNFLPIIINRIKGWIGKLWQPKNKFIDFHHVIDFYAVSNQSTLIFDKNLHSVDEQTKHLIDDYKGMFSRDKIYRKSLFNCNIFKI